MKKSRNRITTLIGMVIAAFALMWADAASGQPLTPNTLFGDVDGTNTLNDIADVIAPDYATLKQSVLTLESQEHVTTNNIQAVVTNLTFAGWGEPFSAWTNNWAQNETYQPTQPVYNYSLVGWMFCMTNSAGETNQTIVIPNTPLFEIDMSTSIGDKTIHFGRKGTAKYRNTLGIAMESSLSAFLTKEEVCGTITNTYVIGYTDWTFSGNVQAGVTYSVAFKGAGQGIEGFVYEWRLKANAEDIAEAYSENEPNPLTISFTTFVGAEQITASRQPITRNALGLARMEDLANYVTKGELENMDTSYYRVDGLTNKNQSVQYVVTGSGITTLNIQVPESGMTKDWLVYVESMEDLELILPQATYWCASEAVTNAISAGTPTALYFSQITEGLYSIGRQELMPITINARSVGTVRSTHKETNVKKGK